VLSPLLLTGIAVVVEVHPLLMIGSTEVLSLPPPLFTLVSPPPPLWC